MHMISENPRTVRDHQHIPLKPSNQNKGVSNILILMVILEYRDRIPVDYVLLHMNYVSFGIHIKDSVDSGNSVKGLEYTHTHI